MKGWKDGLVHKALPHKHEDRSLKPENTYKCQIGMKPHPPFQHVKGRDQGFPQKADQLDQLTLARFRFN